MLENIAPITSPIGRMSWPSLLSMMWWTEFLMCRRQGWSRFDDVCNMYMWICVCKTYAVYTHVHYLLYVYSKCMRVYIYIIAYVYNTDMYVHMIQASKVIRIWVQTGSLNFRLISNWNCRSPSSVPQRLPIVTQSQETNLTTTSGKTMGHWNHVEPLTWLITFLKLDDQFTTTLSSKEKLDLKANKLHKDWTLRFQVINHTAPKLYHAWNLKKMIAEWMEFYVWFIFTFGPQYLERSWNNIEYGFRTIHNGNWWDCWYLGIVLVLQDGLMHTVHMHIYIYIIHGQITVAWCLISSQKVVCKPVFAGTWKSTLV